MAKLYNINDMAKKKKSKNLIYFNLNRLIVFVALTVVFVGAYFILYDKLDQMLNNGKSITTNIPVSLDDGLMVHYVDVGQGDCIVIELPDDKKMLIDAGTSSSENKMISYINSNVFDSGEEKVFDYVLLTHSDADHCGGMARIFSEYQVNCVFRPQIYINSQDKAKDKNAGSTVSTVITNTYTSVVNAMYSEPNCEVYFTDITLMNSTQKICAETSSNYYEFVFYSPTKSYYQEVNCYSPIMALFYNQKVLMFTDDATTDNEQEAINIGLPKVDVLKVGHHGSTTSTSEEFLKVILPTYAVIQVGANNSYNHPKNQILTRLNKINATIYRTDIHQNIVAVVDADGTLTMYSDIGNKIKVEFLLAGAEIILIYFCFFVKYKENFKS